MTRRCAMCRAPRDDAGQHLEIGLSDLDGGANSVFWICEECSGSIYPDWQHADENEYMAKVFGIMKSLRRWSSKRGSYAEEQDWYA